MSGLGTVMDGRPKLIKTELAEFKKSEYAGNKSGYFPIGDRILVKVDESAEQSSGGIHYPEELQERMTMASETGVIVALGETAFRWSFDRTREWSGRKPLVGERVYINRYAGKLLKGKDGILYRVMDDICVAAIELDEDN
jgi:co-chaperonin GroES (HSP10)